MDAEQDWCLLCGAGGPDSLSTRAPSWRSAAAVLGATAILALGAVAAAYAALTKGSGKPRSATVVVARASLPAAPATPTTPGAVTPTTPGAVTPTTPGALGTPTTISPTHPPGLIKPPKIPLTAVTPKPAGKTGRPSKPLLALPPATVAPKANPGVGSTGATNHEPTPILLDTNAAATYNPYGYPASNFGDPTLAIDGDTATAWTAQVDPAVAPKMAEGLVIDLKSARKLSALVLATSTPGMTIQVYGANGASLPTSITDPAWVTLSPSQLQKKKHTRIKLRNATRAFRFVTLWISMAPTSAVGTPQAPGHVSVNELELFPAG
jgi:hypothetical protein